MTAVPPGRLQRSLLVLAALLATGAGCYFTLLRSLPPLKVRSLSVGHLPRLPLKSKHARNPTRPLEGSSRCLGYASQRRPPLPPPPACPPPRLRPPAHQPPPAVMPQAEHVAVLRSFPPSSLQDLAAQRDVLVAYAAASPLAVAAGYCGAYILMQVGAGAESQAEVLPPGGADEWQDAGLPRLLGRSTHRPRWHHACVRIRQAPFAGPALPCRPLPSRAQYSFRCWRAGCGAYGAAACWWQVGRDLQGRDGMQTGRLEHGTSWRCGEVLSVGRCSPQPSCRACPFAHLLRHSLCAVVSTLGSCCCYCLSWTVGRPLAHALWPARLDQFAAEVAGAALVQWLSCSSLAQQPWRPALHCEPIWHRSRAEHGCVSQLQPHARRRFVTVPARPTVPVQRGATSCSTTSYSCESPPSCPTPLSTWPPPLWGCPSSPLRWVSCSSAGEGRGRVAGAGVGGAAGPCSHCRCAGVPCPCPGGAASKEPLPSPGSPCLAGTLLGCLPNNFVAVNTGSHLGELRSLSDL